MSEQARNLNQALLMAVNASPTGTCFKVKRDKRYQDISYQTFQTLALRLAVFFRRHGMAQGERPAIITDNCLE